LLHARGVTIAQSPVAAASLAELISLVENGTISGSIAKSVFEKMMVSGASATAIVERDGLRQLDDEGELVRIVQQVIAANADAVGQFKAGKTNTFGFLVGQVMKAAAGRANPKRVNDVLRRMLAGEAGRSVLY